MLPISLVAGSTIADPRDYVLVVLIIERQLTMAGDKDMTKMVLLMSFVCGMIVAYFVA